MGKLEERSDGYYVLEGVKVGKIKESQKSI